MSLPRARHFMKFPRSQRIRTVRIAATQLAQRAKQALAVSPSFLVRAILPASQKHASFGILPEGIEILRTTRRPRDPDFPFHEFQHFPEYNP